MSAVGDAAGPRPDGLDRRRGSTGPAPTRSCCRGDRGAGDRPGRRASRGRTTSRSASTPRRRRTASSWSARPHVETTGTRTPGRGPARGRRPLPAQRPRPDLRRRAHRRALAAHHAGLAPATCPTPLSRALAVSTAWDMLLKGELSDRRAARLRPRRAGQRAQPGVRRAVPGDGAEGRRAVEPRRSRCPAQLARLAEVAAALAEDPEHRRPALRTLAASATHGRALRRCSTRRPADDNDLAWRVLVAPGRARRVRRRRRRGAARARPRPGRPGAGPRRDRGRARGGGQGRGLGRDLGQALDPGRLPALRVAQRFWRPGAARPAAALGAPLPRRGREARRRRHARGRAR